MSGAATSVTPGTANIFCARHGLQVRRVDAVADVARVIQLQARTGQRAVMPQVAEAMCDPLLALKEELSVSGAIEVADKEPTPARLVDLEPKARPCVRRSDQRCHRTATLCAVPVTLTEPLRVVLSPASIDRAKARRRVVVGEGVAVNARARVVLVAPSTTLGGTVAVTDGAHSHTPVYVFSSRKPVMP